MSTLINETAHLRVVCNELLNSEDEKDYSKTEQTVSEITDVQSFEFLMYNEIVSSLHGGDHGRVPVI